MYAWIWRRLPFGLPGKLIGSLLLVSGVVALLWFVVFPWAEPYLPPYDDVQVGTPDGDVPGGDPGDPGFDGDGDGDGTQPGDGHDLPYDIDEDEGDPTG